MADEGELLGNYAFNISQGILQRVSRFIDALTFVEEDAESGRGGVMGFGHKRNVLNLVEKAPARRVAWDQQEKERIQKKAVAEAAAAKEAAEAAALKARRSRTRRWLLSRRRSRRCRRSPHSAALRPCLAHLDPPHPASCHRTFPHPPHSPTNLVPPPPAAGASCAEIVRFMNHSRLRIACDTGAPDHELA